MVLALNCVDFGEAAKIDVASEKILQGSETSFCNGKGERATAIHTFSSSYPNKKDALDNTPDILGFLGLKGTIISFLSRMCAIIIMITTLSGCCQSSYSSYSRI